MPELADAIESTSPGSAVALLDFRLDELWGKTFRDHPAFDRLFYLASELADFSVIWQLAGLAQGLRNKPGDEEATVRLGLTLILESALVNQGIKRLFHRKRPEPSGPRPLHLRKPLTSSFPSGHASAAFTAAGILGHRDPKLKPLIYTAAAIVSVSRVHVKVHHPTDVIAGAAMGVVFAKIAKRLWPLPDRRS